MENSWIYFYRTHTITQIQLIDRQFFLFEPYDKNWIETKQNWHKMEINYIIF